MGKLEENGWRTGGLRQTIQIMISKCNDGNREFVYDVADWRGCAALEGTVEVPMLKPMRITRDDRGFIAVHVINVITVTVRMVILVRVFVIMIVRFIRGIVMMDVRIVSSAMPMMNQAHDARSARFSDSNPPTSPTVQLWQGFLGFGKWDSVLSSLSCPARETSHGSISAVYPARSQGRTNSTSNWRSFRGAGHRHRGAGHRPICSNYSSDGRLVGTSNCE